MPSNQFQIFSHSYSYSRRSLHQQPPPAPVPAAANYQQPPQPYAAGDNRFDANVIMVLSVLLCALICSLGINSIIRCALRCSRLAAGDSAGRSARLANTGVKKKALKTFPVVNFSTDLKLPGLDSECVICLSEFSAGEKVRILPKCNHGFHVRCIDKWLNSHSSCPTCRHCLIETCHKIVSHCGQASDSTAIVVAPPPPPPHESVVRILPLEPEGLVRNYES